MKPSDNGAPLRGLRVLLAEDEFLIGLALATTLQEAGAEVVGPASTVADALQMAEQDGLSVAVLDIRLGRETVEPVAERLHARGVPFLFYSGQSPSPRMQAAWPDATVLSKPSANRTLTNAVARAGRKAGKRREPAAGCVR